MRELGFSHCWITCAHSQEGYAVTIVEGICNKYHVFAIQIHVLPHDIAELLNVCSVLRRRTDSYGLQRGRGHGAPRRSEDIHATHIMIFAGIADPYSLPADKEETERSDTQQESSGKRHSVRRGDAYAQFREESVNSSQPGFGPFQNLWKAPRRARESRGGSRTWPRQEWIGC